jgi:hypothetical protein
MNQGQPKKHKPTQPINIKTTKIHSFQPTDKTCSNLIPSSHGSCPSSRYGGQSIMSLISQIAFTFIGFFCTMYFVHAVGAGILGEYFLFIAYLGIIYLMADGGFGGAAIKHGSRKKMEN